MGKRKRAGGEAVPTRAVEEMRRRGISFDLLSYAHDLRPSEGFGNRAASALGLPAGLVYKTIMVTVDGRGYAVLVSSQRRISLKKVARVLHAKQAQVMPVEVAQQTTGYVVGGISPFGQRRPHPVLIDKEVEALTWVVVSDGRRGLSLKIAVPDLIAASNALVEDIHSDEVTC